MTNLFMNWHRDVLRAPADEGAGGASGNPGEGGSPAPDIGSRLAAFEGRLVDMAKLVGDLSAGQRSRDAQTELQKFEATLNTKISEADANVTKAEAALAEAIDGGEGSAVARAQRVLTEAVNAHETAKLHLSNYHIRRREEERRQGGGEGAPGRAQPQNGNLDATNLNSWKNKHRSWYGVDKAMTDKAHDIHGRIVSAGAIAVGSPEYFETIDRQMKQSYPDRFGGTPATASGDSGGGRGGGGSPAQGRIPQSVIEGWKRMGIDTSDKAVVERMIGHRSKLVDKGILTPTPVYDRVKER